MSESEQESSSLKKVRSAAGAAMADETLNQVAPLIVITDRDQLLMTSRSSIILFSDRGKPYSPLQCHAACVRLSFSGVCVCVCVCL